MIKKMMDTNSMMVIVMMRMNKKETVLSEIRKMHYFRTNYAVNKGPG